MRVTGVLDVYLSTNLVAKLVSLHCVCEVPHMNSSSVARLNIIIFTNGHTIPQT